MKTKKNYLVVRVEHFRVYGPTSYNENHVHDITIRTPVATFTDEDLAHAYAVKLAEPTQGYGVTREKYDVMEIPHNPSPDFAGD